MLDNLRSNCSREYDVRHAFGSARSFVCSFQSVSRDFSVFFCFRLACRCVCSCEAPLLSSFVFSFPAPATCPLRVVPSVASARHAQPALLCLLVVSFAFLRFPCVSLVSPLLSFALVFGGESRLPLHESRLPTQRGDPTKLRTATGERSEHDTGTHTSHGSTAHAVRSAAGWTQPRTAQHCCVRIRWMGSEATRHEPADKRGTANTDKQTREVTSEPGTAQKHTRTQRKAQRCSHEAHKESLCPRSATRSTPRRVARHVTMCGVGRLPLCCHPACARFHRATRKRSSDCRRKHERTDAASIEASAGARRRDDAAENSTAADSDDTNCTVQTWAHSAPHRTSGRIDDERSGDRITSMRRRQTAHQVSWRQRSKHTATNRCDTPLG